MNIEITPITTKIPMSSLIANKFAVTDDGWLVFRDCGNNKFVAITPAGINGFCNSCDSLVTPLARGTKVTITV
jgi:hypothetical protein